MREKIAFFDFCETLVDFQTADAFVYFVIRNHKSITIRIRFCVCLFLQKVKAISFLERLLKRPLNKRVVLRQIRGIPQDLIEHYAQEYYEQEIRPHQISIVMTILKNLQSEGWRIVLVSGGYDVYLKFFAQNNGIDTRDIISSSIKFNRGKCTGMMDGEDCMGIEKTIRMNMLFNKEEIESRSFSDSKSDLPMLMWTDEAYVICRNDVPKWVRDNNFNSIIWEN